jgi:hypothetical protein
MTPLLRSIHLHAPYTMLPPITRYQVYTKLEECLGEHDRDWRKCQASCITSHGHSSLC